MVWLQLPFCVTPGGAPACLSDDIPGPISSWSQSFVLVRSAGGRLASCDLGQGAEWEFCVQIRALDSKDRPHERQSWPPSLQKWREGGPRHAG